MKFSLRHIIIISCLVGAFLFVGEYHGAANLDSGILQISQSGNASADTFSSKLTVMVSYSDISDKALAKNNALTDWIIKKGREDLMIELEFIPVRNKEADMKIYTLISSNNAPDICFTNSAMTIEGYSSQGNICDLTDALSLHGKKLKEFLGDDILSHGAVNNKQYSVPSKRAFTGKYTTYVRKDWLDALGMAIPSTFQEYIDFLYAVKTIDPGNNGAENIPFGLSLDEMTYENFILFFINKDDTMNYWAYDTLVAPGAKDGLMVLNELYQNGLLNLDFAVDFNNARLKNSIISGNVGSVTLNAGEIYLDRYIKPLINNTPEANYVPCEPFRLTNDSMPVKKQHAPVYQYLFVPRHSQNTTNAIRYLEWLCAAENQAVLQNKGGEGIKSSGTEEYIDYSDFNYSLVSYGLDMGKIDLNAKEIALKNPYYYNDILRSCYISLNGVLQPPVFKNSVKSKLQYDELLNTKKTEILIKSLMAPKSNFDIVYEVLRTEYMGMGGKQIANETISAYQYLSIDE